MMTIYKGQNGVVGSCPAGKAACAIGPGGPHIHYVVPMHIEQIT